MSAPDSPRRSSSKTANHERSEPSRIARKLEDSSGFSLIELLVVMIVIGVLAAIAIPSFLSTKGKAVDVQAKELARTAETTAETISAENAGSYEKVTLAELTKAEPSIRTVASTTEAYLRPPTNVTKNEYTLTAVAADGDELSISRSSAGVVTRKCVSAKTGCSGGKESAW